MPPPTTAPPSEPAARPAPGPPRDEIAAWHLMDETALVDRLMERAIFTADERARIAGRAAQIVRAARVNRHKHGGIDAFMAEYGLASDEGIILLCLAEALLRIPDKETVDALIAEKVGSGQWEKHFWRSDSLLVNASTFGLMIGGGMVRLGQDKGWGPGAVFKRLVSRSGEPFIRQALRQAMRVLGDSFVLGTTIQEALTRAAPLDAKGYRFSYDMLGERARTAADADKYFGRYMAAADAIGRAHLTGRGAINAEALLARPGLSVKLSALHARFDPGKDERLLRELLPRLVELAAAARRNGLMLTVDAEEQDRLDLTLSLFAAAYSHAALKGWPGLGLAVQAYGKRAIPALRWLRRLAHQEGKPIPLQLVKGAYWDSEIKWAQERGLADYPVLTRKVHTDLILACVHAPHHGRPASLRAAACHPQRALHRCRHRYRSLHARLRAPAPARHGRGGLRGGGGRREHGRRLPHLRAGGAARRPGGVSRPAPAGERRQHLVRQPAGRRRRTYRGAGAGSHGRHRRRAGGRSGAGPAAASAGYFRARAPQQPRHRARRAQRTPAAAGEARAELKMPFAAAPVIDGKALAGTEVGRLVRCPHDLLQRIGTVRVAEAADVERAIAGAQRAAHAWDRLGGPARAAILDKAANLYERDRARLMAVLVREAGKTLENALGDVREAIDFLRYYAAQTRRLFAGPVTLRGPTGERNTLELRGRGPFACISPWNFPLAIFTGQVAAALAAGNPVLAKPAEQTPIVAYLATGFPQRGRPAAGGAAASAGRRHGRRRPGEGQACGGRRLHRLQRHRLGDPAGAGRAARGHGAADRRDRRAQRHDRQFQRPAGAGHPRRGALRLQFGRPALLGRAPLLRAGGGVAIVMIDMLVGAVEALEIGDPLDYATDIGPVIDEEAAERLDAHKLRMQRQATQLVDLALPPECEAGTYVTPAVFEIANAGLLKEEVFGPILHVVRYAGGRLDRVIEAINASGYGLTLGLHSRIAAVADYVAEHAHVGNLYVNRNQIGAVVGVQPFGGEGLSGTGPKAGGPNYLARFATERVRTTDITATGGNVALLGLEDSE